MTETLGKSSVQPVLMQNKKDPHSHFLSQVAAFVGDRIAAGFRHAGKLVDEHRGALDATLGAIGIVLDVISMVSAYDITGFSLIIELLELVLELSGNPRVRAAVIATARRQRAFFHRIAAAGHRRARVVRAGVRRAHRALGRLRHHLSRAVTRALRFLSTPR